MTNGIGNAPVAALAFLAFSGAEAVPHVGSIFISILVALVAALLGKGVDVLVKNWLASRRDQWRKRALEAEAKLAELKAHAEEL